MLPELRRHLVALSLCAVTLARCTQVSYEPPARLGLKLPPSALESPINLHQQLIIERQGRIEALDAALEVDAQKLELVGLTLGQRVFSLSYDGRELKSWRHPLLPPGLREEDVLEDLQLSLWPASAIKPVLPARWRIEEGDRRRTLLLNDAPVLLIDYSGEPRWLGRIAINNLRYQYRLGIFSVPAGP
jgi:Protein of unknown function (DUF3261)